MEGECKSKNEGACKSDSVKCDSKNEIDCAKCEPGKCNCNKETAKMEKECSHCDLENCGYKA